MPQYHPLTIKVNDQFTIDVGYWQECVEEEQMLSYLVEAIRYRKVPPKFQLHFAVLTNRDLPQWAAAFDPEVSCIGDGEVVLL